MTWTKLSDDFADDCARVGLSDAAFRVHVEGLLWCMRRETGGTFDALAVRRGLEVADPDTAIAELLAVGFWQRVEGGYLVVHGMEHQPEPEVLEKRRDNDAERQRRKRRKDAGLLPEKDVSRRDDTRDNPRDPGRDGTGLVGTGKAQLEEQPLTDVPARTHAREAWPEVPPLLRSVSAQTPPPAMSDAERWQLVAGGYDN